MCCDFCAAELSAGAMFCDRCGWRVARALICNICALVLMAGRSPIVRGLCADCGKRAFNER